MARFIANLGEKFMRNKINRGFLSKICVCIG